MVLKSVYLDYSSKEFYVTQAGYDAIKALIQQHQVCGECRQPIDQADHLLIGKNLCLACLLRRQPRLTFLGIAETDDDGNNTYSFRDEAQVVHTIKANSGTETSKDIFQSIQLQGFILPETFVPFKGDKDNPITLTHHYWTVYGKLTNSVIVAEYDERYGEKTHAVFLCYKGGEAVELNKRNSTHKQLFHRAQEVIERTKHGSYYTDTQGYEISRIFDSHLYPIIAQMESAVYDVQQQMFTFGSQQS